MADTSRIDERGSRRRRLGRALVVVPLVVLAAMYAWLAVDHGTLRLGDVVVHESGRHTLTGTMLYFAHFLREVPVAVTYALFLLGASGGAALVGAGRGGTAPAVTFWLGALLLVVAAFTLAARTDGADSALRDLFQYRTRDDVLEFGSHWRYHLLSTAWFGAAITVVAAASQRVTALPVLALHRAWTRAAWIWFTLLTLVFGFSTEVVADPRYAGHQAREILTHAAITLPAGLGVLIAAGGRAGVAGRVGNPAAAAAAVGVFGIPVLLAFVATSGGGVMEHGQAEQGLGAMVAAHYFEHTLDYLLVLLLLLGGLALNRPRDRSHVTVATHR